MEKSRLKKNFFWNFLGSTFNSFTSLFFMIIVTRINGLSDAGVFTFAFSTSSILFIFGTYAGRLFQVTDTTKTNDKEYIASRIITCFLSMTICILFVLFNKYDYLKSLIIITLCLYKTIESFCDVFYGILQKNERLDIVGKSYLIKSILCVLLFLIVDLVKKNILLSIISMIVLTIILSILIELRLSIKVIDHEKNIDIKNVLKIFSKGFAVFIITLVPIAILNVPKYIIDYCLDDNMQAIFGIIIMPATVLSLFSQYIIHPELTNVAKMNKKKEYNQLKKLLYKMMILVICFGTLCIIGASLIGIPVLELIYGIELDQYKLYLLIILLAATINTTAGIISPFLIAMRYNLSQVIIGVLTIFFEVLLSIILVRKYSMGGVMYAYLFSMVFNFVLYFLYTYRLMNKKLRGNNI